VAALHKILVVDDDPVVGKSFNRVLSEGKGYVVITAHNAAEALEKLREQEYDVVFTDIKMPVMDGVELAEQVKARRPWTPVVIVTGYGSGANEARARAAGVSGFMHKPLTPEMIEESAVHALLKPAKPMMATRPAVRHEEALAPQVVKESRLKNIALFLAAPFIGLAYALLLPVVGVAMLAWVGGSALAKNQQAMTLIKNTALLMIAPFIGLAYAVLLPFVGLATLIWFGLQAFWEQIHK
jgi:CheY-like chemotaxis protein